MKKTILAASLMTAVFCINLTGQEGKCPRFRIAVTFDEITAPDSTVARLNKKYKKNLTENEWRNEIEVKILDELKDASYENLEFFSQKLNPDLDADFRFNFSLMPWSVDKDEIIPGYEVKYIDEVTGWEVTEYRAPRYNQEPAYRMTSRLANCSTCFPSLSYYLSVEIVVDIDIYQLIKNLIHFYNWPLDKIISDWEEKHSAPARKPEMEIQYEKEFLSLLDDDARKMEVSIKVKNCHGNYVYEESHSQPVYFEKETERPKTKSSIKCEDGPDLRNFRTIMTNKDYEAICEYSVKNGLEASKELVKFMTCGIGTNSVIETEKELIVRGLELLVEPWRTVIHNGEQTTISVDLHETDPDGFKFPAADQEIEIKVTGLVDGAISPEGKVTTDEMGVAWIDYKAGKEDKQIKITATFSPLGYSEKVTADATITVKPLEYDATLTVKGSYRLTENSSFEEKNNWGTNESSYELNELREASFYIPLKMENSYDVEVQNLRYEYYLPLDINLSHFNAGYRRKEFRSSIGSDQGSKTTVLKNKISTVPKLSVKEVMLQNFIVMTLDLKTGKVLKIDIDGFPVEFTWKETIDTHHESWWQPPPQPGHETKDDTGSSSEDDSFFACPVEDPVPDPTVKSSTAEIMKYLKDMGVPLPAETEAPGEEEVALIAPDLLVKYGDGKTYFGGEGWKITDSTDGPEKKHEEFHFSWQATRKRKAF